MRQCSKGGALSPSTVSLPRCGRPNYAYLQVVCAIFPNPRDACPHGIRSPLLNFYFFCWCALLRFACACALPCGDPVLQAHIDIGISVSLYKRVHLCCICSPCFPLSLFLSLVTHSSGGSGISTSNSCAPSISHSDFLRCHCRHCGSMEESFSISAAWPCCPCLLQRCSERMPSHGSNAACHLREHIQPPTCSSFPVCANWFHQLWHLFF